MWLSGSSLSRLQAGAVMPCYSFCCKAATCWWRPSCWYVNCLSVSLQGLSCLPISAFIYEASVRALGLMTYLNLNLLRIISELFISICTQNICSEELSVGTALCLSAMRPPGCFRFRVVQVETASSRPAALNAFVLFSDFTATFSSLPHVPVGFLTAPQVANFVTLCTVKTVKQFLHFQKTLADNAQGGFG